MTNDKQMPPEIWVYCTFPEAADPYENLGVFTREPDALYQAKKYSLTCMESDADCEVCKNLRRINCSPDEDGHTHPCDDCRPEALAEFNRGMAAEEFYANQLPEGLEQAQEPGIQPATVDRAWITQLCLMHNLTINDEAQDLITREIARLVSQPAEAVNEDATKEMLYAGLHSTPAAMNLTGDDLRAIYTAMVNANASTAPEEPSP